MTEVTAEQFGQRLVDLNLLEPRQLDAVVGELGTRHTTLEQLTQLLLRRELLTNWQIDRVLEGHMTGFFYGPFKVQYIVGAGTFARVYRGVHKTTGEVRAVKVLRQRYTEDAATRERFLQEAKMVQKLRHPNIVPIYEIGEEKSRYYMIMEFVEGQNLRDFVRVHKKLKIQNALTITKDIATGLEYAFQLGITHRDLKLSNVLLSTKGRAMIVDFGLAAAASVADKTSDQIGNPRSIDYAGLERATGVRRDDKRSDIFFLGCMAYHMLCGKPALYETRERIQRLSISRFREMVPITVVEPNLPHRVVLMVSRCMELNVDARFQSPGEVANEIKDILVALEQGDYQRYDENQAKIDAEKIRKRELELHEGRNKTVMLIESNVQMQDHLRERLKGVGYKVLIYSDPRRALQRFSDAMDNDPNNLPADCVLFSTATLGFESLDAFNEFGKDERTRSIPAILITKENQDNLAEEAKVGSTRLHMPMPLKFKVVRRNLRKLLNIPEPEKDDE